MSIPATERRRSNGCPPSNKSCSSGQRAALRRSMHPGGQPRLGHNDIWVHRRTAASRTLIFFPQGGVLGQCGDQRRREEPLFLRRLHWGHDPRHDEHPSMLGKMLGQTLASGWAHAVIQHASVGGGSKDPKVAVNTMLGQRLVLPVALPWERHEGRVDI